MPGGTSPSASVRLLVMKAYIVVNAKILDPELLATYGKAAGPTIGAYGAKPLIVTNTAETLEGDPIGERVVVLEFESREKAMGWYNSPEYQAPKAQRLEATSGVLLLADGLS